MLLLWQLFFKALKKRHGVQPKEVLRKVMSQAAAMWQRHGAVLGSRRFNYDFWVLLGYHLSVAKLGAGRVSLKVCVERLLRAADSSDPSLSAFAVLTKPTLRSDALVVESLGC